MRVWRWFRGLFDKDKYKYRVINLEENLGFLITFFGELPCPCDKCNNWEREDGGDCFKCNGSGVTKHKYLMSWPWQ